MPFCVLITRPSAGADDTTSISVEHSPAAPMKAPRCLWRTHVTTVAHLHSALHHALAVLDAYQSASQTGHAVHIGCGGRAIRRNDPYFYECRKCNRIYYFELVADVLESASTVN